METWQRELAETIAKQRRQGWGWRWDGLDDWSSEAIFAKLRELGIDTDAERFRQQATAARGTDALREGWDGQIREEMDTGFWPDFPLRAAPVLWERLTPDLVCPELIDERLHRAIRAEKQGTELPPVEGVPATVAAAIGLAKYLEGFPAAERAKRFDEMSRHGMYDYGNWLVEWVYERGPDYPDVVLRVADVMVDCANGINFQADAGLVLATAGRRDEAIERAQGIVDKFNDDLWSRIYAGDIHKELGDIGEAKRFFIEALAMASDSRDRDTVAERLKSICKEPEEEALLKQILRTHPMPKRTPAPRITVTPRPAPAIPTRTVSPPSAPTKKIGRNDPCPCGSGKKYKKCCFR